MYNLYPPFLQLWITLLHPLDVLLRVSRINQGKDDILNNEPPFIIMNNTPNFTLLKKRYAAFRLKLVIH